MKNVETGRRPGRLVNVVHVPYQLAWEYQRSLVRERQEHESVDTLLLVEHEPVFTLGRRTKAEHFQLTAKLLKDGGFGMFEVERGGSVTYHGPGQIVGYPILCLRDFCAGPKSYVGMLQDVLMRVLADWNIGGSLREEFPGVWVKDGRTDSQKIAAIGVRIARGITMHGWALNVNVDLAPFDLITPCGIEGCQVTSMARLLDQEVSLLRVRERLAHHFAEVFKMEWKDRRTTLPNVEVDMTAHAVP